VDERGSEDSHGLMHIQMTQVARFDDPDARGMSFYASVLLFNQKRASWEPGSPGLHDVHSGIHAFV
jgi:hypothetical protein